MLNFSRTIDHFMGRYINSKGSFLKKLLRGENDTDFPTLRGSNAEGGRIDKGVKRGGCQ